MLPSIFFLFSCASTYSVFLVSTEPDDAIREPMLAVIHAAHRTELQELHVLKDMLSARYGSEFADAALENPDGRVPERITRKLAFSMPSPELVDAYLTESMCDSAGEGRLTNLFFSFQFAERTKSKYLPRSLVKMQRKQKLPSHQIPARPHLHRHPRVIPSSDVRLPLPQRYIHRTMNGMLSCSVSML